MSGELLDETIDRVAEQMTMPPANSMFSVDVRQALGAPARSAFTPALVGAAAAIVAVAIGLPLWQSDPRPGDSPEGTRRTLDSQAVAPIASLPRAARRAMGKVPSAVVPQTLLEVAPLNVEPLHVEAILEVEPLDVKDIVISDMVGGEMKEPR